MKTKVGRHLPRINIKHFTPHSHGRWQANWINFQPRHENKRINIKHFTHWMMTCSQVLVKYYTVGEHSSQGAVWHPRERSQGIVWRPRERSRGRQKYLECSCSHQTMPRERSSGRQTMPIERSQGHQTAPQGECSLTVNAHCFPVKLSYIAYIAIYKGDTLKTISNGSQQLSNSIWYLLSPSKHCTNLSDILLQF